VPIAFLTLELSIEHAQSLKDKRQVVRSLKDRLRAHFNVATAELDPSSLWNRATIGVVRSAAIPQAVESLIELPAAMTHLSVAGSPLEVPAGLVRLSVGIEAVDDLIADLDAALAAAAG